MAIISLLEGSCQCVTLISHRLGQYQSQIPKTGYSAIKSAQSYLRCVTCTTQGVTHIESVLTLSPKLSENSINELLYVKLCFFFQKIRIVTSGEFMGAGYLPPNNNLAALPVREILPLPLTTNGQKYGSETKTA